MSRFWEFQQLSDEWRGTSFFDEIPLPSPSAESVKGRGKIFLGGVAAFYREPDALKENRVESVLSVIDFSIEDAIKERRRSKEKDGEGLKWLWIQVEDQEDEELLEKFEGMNKFIDEEVEGGGGIFIHCAMGVSRSATVVCAYFMWKFGMGREEALRRVRMGKGRVRPNKGFWEQLGIYERMLKCEKEEERREVLRGWKRRKEKKGKL